MLAALLLTGCAGDSPSASPSALPSVAPTTTPSVAGTVPETPPLPPGFPVMPGMVAEAPLPDAPGLIGRWTTKANGAEVYAFLADALPAAGYRVDLLAPGGTAAVIRFTPPDGQQLQIDLGPAGDRTFMELRLPRG